MDGVLAYVTLFAGNFAPRNWAFCSGQIIPISTNTALFSLLGTTYGGNGQTTFALPDLRGRAVVGVGQAPGLSPYYAGETGGSEVTSMLQTQMPVHNHTLQVTLTPPASVNVSTTSPVNGVYGTGTESLYNGSADSMMQPYPAKLTIGNTGGGQPFSTLHPVLALNYIICLYGSYPARN